MFGTLNMIFAIFIHVLKDASIVANLAHTCGTS